MIKKLIVLAAFLSCLLTSFAQSTDSDNQPKYTQYIGVQANELIKQIVNLNNSSTVITNPYLLTYTILSNKCGWGIEAGLGINYQDTQNKVPVSDESKNNDYNFRIGICKKFKIGKRFEAGFGLDIIYNYSDDVTTSSTSTVSGGFTDSSSTVTTTKITGIGFGPQLYLGFNISQRVILGTEVSYYYTSSTQKENVFNTDTQIEVSGNQTITTSTSSNSNLETDIKSLSFSFPTVIFLIVKF
jgi:hypothetical protein